MLTGEGTRSLPIDDDRMAGTGRHLRTERRKYRVPHMKSERTQAALKKACTLRAPSARAHKGEGLGFVLLVFCHSDS